MPDIEPISVRDFLRNFAAIVKKTGTKKYLIMKHGKPIGLFSPWKAVKKDVLADKENWGSFLDKY
ncbi:hypothetical protein HOI18_00190 [Candidatus Uhrbacteria bacterium]|nr:hypothetical protein [Candidatus Uhrbacteria bacterium]